MSDRDHPVYLAIRALCAFREVDTVRNPDASDVQQWNEAHERLGLYLPADAARSIDRAIEDHISDRNAVQTSKPQ